MSRPWLETWRVDRRGENVENQHGSTVLILMETPEDGSRLMPDRADLAASAPALVRALLAVDWEWWHDGRHGELLTADRSPYKMNEFQGPWCPCCEAEVGNHWPQDQKHARDCMLDKALTAAGLPDQVSRDAARKAIAERRT